MTLSEKQSTFTQMIGLLIAFAFKNNYNLTFGDAYRDHRATFPYSHPNSLHHIRLAVDFNVFKEGHLLLHGKEFLDLGEYWENLGGTWGGRFKDGGHFSLEHGGMK